MVCQLKWHEVCFRACACVRVYVSFASHSLEHTETKEVMRFICVSLARDTSGLSVKRIVKRIICVSSATHYIWYVSFAYHHLFNSIQLRFVFVSPLFTLLLSLFPLREPYDSFALQELGHIPYVVGPFHLRVISPAPPAPLSNLISMIHGIEPFAFHWCWDVYERFICVSLY